MKAKEAVRRLTGNGKAKVVPGQSLRVPGG
jgi:hypothetical protein